MHATEFMQALRKKELFFPSILTYSDQAQRENRRVESRKDSRNGRRITRKGNKSMNRLKAVTGHKANRSERRKAARLLPGNLPSVERKKKGGGNGTG